MVLKIFIYNCSIFNLTSHSINTYRIKILTTGKKQHRQKHLSQYKQSTVLIRSHVTLTNINQKIEQLFIKIWNSVIVVYCCYLIDYLSKQNNNKIKNNKINHKLDHSDWQSIHILPLYGRLLNDSVMHRWYWLHLKHWRHPRK